MIKKITFGDLDLLSADNKKWEWKGKMYSLEDYEKIRESDEREERVQLRYEQSGVGERYFSKRLSDFETKTEEQKNALEKIKMFICDIQKGKQRTLWLNGAVGTGKTLLASLIIRECGGKFVKSYQIQNELEDCRSFKATESKSDLIKRYSTVRPVLVIDEIGKIDTKMEIEYLFQIINERYEHKGTSTILITNKTKVELKEYLGKAIFNRFVENCTAVEFFGESYRIKEREE